MNINQYADTRTEIGFNDVFDVEWFDSTSGTFNTAKISGATFFQVFKSFFGLFSQTSDSTPVTNTTTESSLISTGEGSLTVPANTFKVGDAFTAVVCGEISSDNNETIEFLIKTASGTLLASSGVITLPQCNNQSYDLELEFTVRTVGVSGAIMTAGEFMYNKDSSNNWEGQGFRY